MGKNLIQQARGTGSPTYRSPGHRFKGSTKHRSWIDAPITKGKILDFTHCPGHSSPLALVEYEDGELSLLPAPEGMKVGDHVEAGTQAAVTVGNTLPLSAIPEGTEIFNIEATPGDGGKFVRSSGVFARIVAQQPDKVVVMLPSKKEKTFNPKCRAIIGIVSGGGRPEKPWLKAGKKMHAMRARNKLYPNISGAAQNAVDHPFGNKRTSRKSKARPTSRNAPPGRKVGMIAARRTGRKK